MTDILSSLRGFESLCLPPEEPISFVPSIARAGTVSNIYPDHAELCFALRNFLSNDDLKNFIGSIKSRVTSIIGSYPRANLASFSVNHGYPALHNNHKIHRRVKSILSNAQLRHKESPLLFAGEDFTYFLKQVPGSFWCLGAKQDEGWDHHTSKFNPDENSLWLGVCYWLLLASQ